MTKLSAKMAARLKNYRSSLKSAGFSMLEAVVVVGVLLALAVSGFIAYGSITKNAKQASVESAAASVYTAALAANMDGDDATTVAKVVSDYNASQSAITITPSTDTSDRALTITATNKGDATITATKGAPLAP